jgi:HK97 gp10 family phage protein
MSAQVIQVFDRRRFVTAAIQKSARICVAKACFDTEAEAKRRAPVDTGALANSIYSNVGGKNGYPLAEAAVNAARPGAGVLPEETPANDTEGVVSVAVEYASYVEYGTVRAPAQPYFTPAVEKVAPEFVKLAAAALRGELGS